MSGITVTTQTISTLIQKYINYIKCTEKLFTINSKLWILDKMNESVNEGLFESDATMGSEGFVNVISTCFFFF